MPDLQDAIGAIKSGDKATGKQLLREILKTDQRNESAWLWMTQCVNTDDERLRCLQNVLRINPNSEQAKRGLAALQQRQASQQSPRVETPPKLIEPPLEPVPPPPANQLQPVDLSQKVCLYCSETIKAETRFCPSCGRRQEIDQQANEPVEPQIVQTPLKAKPEISSENPSLKKLKPTQETKKCPYCAETIKAEATLCRFCGKDLTKQQQASQPTTKTIDPELKKKNNTLFILALLGTVVVMCVVVVSSIDKPKQNGSVENQKQNELSYENLCSETHKSTEIQWEDYFKKHIEGKETVWTGKVLSVKQEKDGYSAWVDMDESRFSVNWEVKIENIDRDTAMSLQENQVHSFKGTINYFSDEFCIGGLDFKK